MNYRHAFHAGNFADLVKHGALTVLLDLMTGDARPLTVIDTHAGAGAYDIAAAPARRSGEADRGIVRLMADPAAPEAFDLLVAAVSRINPGGRVRMYPGSPLLIAAALRPGDRFTACELQPAEHGALENLMGSAAVTLKADGYAVAAAQTPASGRVVIHIDPPYERGDDYARAVETAAAVAARNPAAVTMIWLPLKDLDTFDRFLTRLEGAIGAPVLVAEARLHPLDDPLQLNGCALAVVNPPAALEFALAEICRWTAQTLGGDGAQARTWNL